MPFSLYLLALAVFAMGTSEFMLAGLLPDIASDLNVPIGTAGLLTSAYAIGMVVGAPLMAAVARSWPPRFSLFGFIWLFLAAHVLGAVTDSFTILVITRVVAALANAGFLAVALSAAVRLTSPQRKGRALAILLSGTTIAMVAGVPGGALMGTLLDWRAPFWTIAVLCLPAMIGVHRAIPRHASVGTPRPQPSLSRELAQLRRPRLVLVLSLAALVNAATFGMFTFLAPIVTDTAALPPQWIPAALILFGIGAFLGLTAAGRWSDQRPWRVIAVTAPLLLSGWITLAVTAHHPVALLVLTFTQGALAFALGSTLITRILYEAVAAPTMAGSYATAALNVGATVGPVLAATTLPTGLGALGPVWTAAALVAVSLLIALATRRVLIAEPTAH